MTLGFQVTNLLIPGDPQQASIPLSSGTWILTRQPRFVELKAALREGQCAETYFLEHAVRVSDGAAAVDAALDELTPILLAASFATGMSVTIERSTPSSAVLIMQPTQHWPRARAIDQPSSVVATETDFCELLSRFVHAWPHAGQVEKVRLLVHHWLDALACWSMEDLYLSATTLLQVIAATEVQRQGKSQLNFYTAINGAAHAKGIRSLSADFKNMRNDLIHDGCLIGKRFAGPDKKACAAVVVDVLNWFDEYVHEALSLGARRKTRFEPHDLASLNAYSID